MACCGKKRGFIKPKGKPCKKCGKASAPTSAPKIRRPRPKTIR